MQVINPQKQFFLVLENMHIFNSLFNMIYLLKGVCFGYYK